MIEPTDEMVLRVNLGRGLVALIDECDGPLVAQLHWHSKPGRNTTYAQAHRTLSVGRYSTIMMHRLILGEPKAWIDHVNGNGLDNRRSNLRLTTNALNIANSGLQSGNKSGFKGVHWNRKDNGWRAEITVSRKKRYLGTFANREDAARAYDAAAREFFGSYARTNFPVPS